MKPLQLDWQHILGSLVIAGAVVLCLYLKLIPSELGAAILAGLAGIHIPATYGNLSPPPST